MSFRFLEYAPLFLSLDLGSLTLVDWFGHSVRGFSLGVLSLGLSVFCILCGCFFSFCFRFSGLGLVMVTPTCSGRLTVAPGSGLFDLGSLGWLFGLGLDCLLSGWNGFASGFSGLCGLKSILRTVMGMSVLHDWSHSQSGDMHFTDLASTLLVFSGGSIVM